MTYVPTPEQAKELLLRYNKEPFHIQHAETVSKVMGELAKKYDPEKVDFWRSVGMLHDIDFELYPEQHCVKANEMLHELEVDEEVIHAAGAATGVRHLLRCGPGEVHGKGALCRGRAHRAYRRRRPYAAYRHLRYGA